MRCVDLARIRGLARSGRARKIRIDGDVSLREMARDLNVDPSTLGRWETARTRPGPEAALRWLDLLIRIEATGRRRSRAC